jgi:hypothetical protein
VVPGGASWLKGGFTKCGSLSDIPAGLVWYRMVAYGTVRYCMVSSCPAGVVWSRMGIGGIGGIRWCSSVGYDPM